MSDTVHRFKDVLPLDMDIQTALQPLILQHLRKLMERDDIDAVAVATPDH